MERQTDKAARASGARFNRANTRGTQINPDCPSSDDNSSVDQLETYNQFKQFIKFQQFIKYQDIPFQREEAA